MHPLTTAITEAVTEFSNNHQSLRQLMVNTLVAIVEGKVTTWLRERENLHSYTFEDMRRQRNEHQRRANDAVRTTAAEITLRQEAEAAAQSAIAQLDKAEKERDEAIRWKNLAMEEERRARDERDGWKKRAEAFLDFDRLKGVLHGEFEVEHYDGCDSDTGEPRHATTTIPWTTIKDILKAAALPSPDRTVPLVGGGTTTLPVESKREVMP